VWPRPDLPRHRGLSRRIALLGLTSTLAVPRRVGASERDETQAPAELTGPLIDQLTRSLRQTVTELQSVSVDPTINRLLDAVALTVDRRVVSLSPNASASRLNGRPLVQIDLAFVYDMMREADFVAARLITTPASEPVIRKASEDLGRKLRTASLAGLPPPKLSFDIERAGIPPLDTELLRLLSQVIQNTTLAWIVLHEVGHHVLGHTLRRPSSAAESRSDELAADRFGVEALMRIGYSPEPLRDLLKFRAALTQLQRMAGYRVDDANASHPPWDERSDQIDALSRNSVVPSFPVQVVQWCGEAPDGTISSPVITYNTDPTVARSLCAIGEDGKSLAIYQRSGTAITVYARSASYRQEITIEHTDNFIVELAIRTIAPGSDTTVRATGVNKNFATRQRILPDTPNLVDMMAFSNGGVKAINRRLLGPEKAEQVDAIQADTAQRGLGSFLDYCKGNGDMNGYLRRGQEIASHHEAELRRVLGERDYAAYRSAINQFMRENVMTEGILGRLDQSKAQHDAAP